jgi:hypothetical protein
MSDPEAKLRAIKEILAKLEAEVAEAKRVLRGEITNG